MSPSITTSLGPIHVTESGTGEPVVFIHPFMTTHLHWRKVVPLLDGDVRCITPTFPFGSHESPMNAEADLSPPGLARVVVEVLDALDVDRATLVGNDTGGAIAQIAAATYPERISRLVLTSCDAYDVFPPSLFKYLKVVAAVPGASSVLAYSLLVPGIARLPIAYGWVTQRRIPSDVIRAYTRPLVRDARIRRDVRKVIKGLDTRYTEEAGSALRSFDGDALIAWGADDRFFPRRLAERLARELPRAQLEIVEDAATFVPEDNPERLSELIRKFLL